MRKELLAQGRKTDSDTGAQEDTGCGCEVNRLVSGLVSRKLGSSPGHATKVQ